MFILIFFVFLTRNVFNVVAYGVPHVNREQHSTLNSGYPEQWENLKFGTPIHKLQQQGTAGSRRFGFVHQHHTIGHERYQDKYHHSQFELSNQQRSALGQYEPNIFGVHQNTRYLNSIPGEGHHFSYEQNHRAHTHIPQSPHHLESQFYPHSGDYEHDGESTDIKFTHSVIGLEAARGGYGPDADFEHIHGHTI